MCVVDPMRQSGVLSAETVAVLVTAVVVVPLTTVSLVVVARICRRRHRHKQQQQQQQLLHTHHQPASLQYHETGVKLATGGGVLQRQRE